MDSICIVKIEVSGNAINEYLDENDMGSLFFDIEDNYECGNCLNAELDISIGKSLVNILKAYMEDSPENWKNNQNKINKFCNFLIENEKLIAEETEADIEIKYSESTDGFAYYQSLKQDTEVLQLIQWPFNDGWGINHEKIQKLNNDGTEGTLYEVVLDKEALDESIDNLKCKIIKPSCIRKNELKHEELDYKSILDYEFDSDRNATVIKGLKKGGKLSSKLVIPGIIEGHSVIIGSHAFEKQQSLTEVIIEEGVIEIDDWAFGECKNLKNVSIPKTLREISIVGFVLTKYWNNVCENNEDYSVIGCLLLHYHGEKANNERIIPNNVKYINSCALTGSSACKTDKIVEKVVLPNGIEALGAFAFKDNRALREINIPVTLKEIGFGAFCNCDSLDAKTKERILCFNKNAFSDLPKDEKKTFQLFAPKATDSKEISQKTDVKISFAKYAQDAVKSILKNEWFKKEGLSAEYDKKEKKLIILTKVYSHLFWKQYTLEEREALENERQLVLSIMKPGEDVEILIDPEKWSGWQVFYKNNLIGVIGSQYKYNYGIALQNLFYDIRYCKNKIEIKAKISEVISKKIRKNYSLLYFTIKMEIKEKMPVEDIGDFAYVIENNEANLLKWVGDYSVKTVHIPSSIHGIKVNSIRTNLFDCDPYHTDKRSEVEEIIIDEGIESIGKLTFGDIPKLKRVILPDSINYIDEDFLVVDYDFENEKLYGCIEDVIEFETVKGSYADDMLENYKKLHNFSHNLGRHVCITYRQD